RCSSLQFENSEGTTGYTYGPNCEFRSIRTALPAACIASSKFLWLTLVDLRLSVGPTVLLMAAPYRACIRSRSCRIASVRRFAVSLLPAGSPKPQERFRLTYVFLICSSQTFRC